MLNWIHIDVPGALAIMPRPRAGDVRLWSEEGVQRVVSLLRPREEPGEAAECQALGVTFVCHPIEDLSLPENEAACDALILELADRLRSGDRVAVHCEVGIGRSGLVCAATLVALGVDPVAAFERVSAARQRRVPDTEAQRQWVIRFASRRF